MYDLYVKTCLTIIQRPSAKGGNFHKDNYLYCDVSQILSSLLLYQIKTVMY